MLLDGSYLFLCPAKSCFYCVGFPRKRAVIVYEKVLYQSVRAHLHT